MTPFARIARSSAAFFGSNMARAAIGFGLSFLLARSLGAERFGRWIFCTAWASTLTVVADLGLGVLLTRDAARPGADAGRLASGALVLRLTLVVPLAALLYAGAGRLSSDAETATALRMAALLGASGAVYGCFGALYRSQVRWLPAVLAVETGWLTIQLAAAGWMAHAGVSVGALIALAVAVQCAQIATAVVCWPYVFGDRRRPRWPATDSLLPLARRALPFAAAGLVANVQTRIGPLMLGYLSTQADVGFFAAASRFGVVARLAPQAVFAGALPVLSHEHAHDRAAAERVFHSFDRVLLAASAAMAAASALFAAPALRLVYGSPFVPAAPALMWVGVGMIPLLSNSGRKVFLYASGGEALVVRWSSVALALQVCVGALLMPVYGSSGAAIGVAIGEAAIWWPLRHAATGRQVGHFRAFVPSWPK